jgi:hypothetical protein
MSNRRIRRKQATLAERNATLERDLIVVAAAVDAFDGLHPALLSEPRASDHPLVAEPIAQHVLTHDHDGDDDE